MTAVAKLPEKWRATAEAIAKPYGFVTEHTLGKAEALSNCADELTAALSPAELGGVEVSEAVETLRHKLANDEGGWRALCAVMGAIAYTTPRAAEAVSEEVQDAVDSILSQLGGWAKAYPLDIFSEPTDEEREWLHTTKPGLMDRIAASMGRHVAKCIAEDLAALTASLTPPSAKEEL